MSYDDLKSKKIGLLCGASYPVEFMEFLKNNSTYKEVAKNSQNFLMLATGRVEFIVAEHGNGMFLIKKLGLVGKIVPLLSKPIRENNLYIIFSKKTVSSKYVRRFSSALKEFKNTDTYADIYRKYFVE